MPTISEFYGIIIYMYFNDNERHHEPHIHAWYSGDEAVFSIISGDCLRGELPNKANKKIVKWINLNRKKLLKCWNLAIKQEELPKIRGLE